MGIDKVEVEQYTCDNPGCKRLFQPIGGTKQPGLRGTATVTFGQSRPVRVEWWAHTFRCTGPAIKAAYERVIAKEAGDGGS